MRSTVGSRRQPAIAARTARHGAPLSGPPDMTCRRPHDAVELTLHVHHERVTERDFPAETRIAEDRFPVPGYAGSITGCYALDARSI